MNHGAPKIPTADRRALAAARNGLADAVRAAARASALPRWSAADDAPSTLADVVAHYRATGALLVYAGASDAAVFDAQTNRLFRAWHDWGHVRTLIGFDVASECALARFQMAESGSDALGRLVWVEVAEQALHFGRTGEFLADQIGFTLAALARGVRVPERETALP